MSSPLEPLSFPPALLAEVQAAAAEQHRPVGELVQEAVERYLRDCRWQKTFAYGEQRARALGIQESDLTQILCDYRHDRDRP